MIIRLLALSLLAVTSWGHDITLTWNRSTDPNTTGYKIMYGPSSQPTTNIWRVGLTNAAKITGLISAPSVLYRFVIIPTNAVTEGNPTADILSLVTPHAVKNPRFVGRTPNGFTVAWAPTDEADIASYKVTYGTTTPRTTNTLVLAATNTVATITNGTVPNMEHYFNFTAINTSGVESWPMYELRDKLLAAGPPDLRVTVKVE